MRGVGGTQRLLGTGHVPWGLHRHELNESVTHLGDCDSPGDEEAASKSVLCSKARQAGVETEHG